MARFCPKIAVDVLECFLQTAGIKTEVAYGFPLVRGLKHVAGGHIMGTGLQGRTEITWNAFATDRRVGDVVAC